MTTHTTSERIEDELVRRLMHQLIVVLGEELGCLLYTSDAADD